jgi:hypothetical protein
LRIVVLGFPTFKSLVDKQKTVLFGKSKTAEDMWNDLDGDNQVHVIKESKSAKNVDRSIEAPNGLNKDGSYGYNPYKMKGGVDVNGGVARPPEIGLAHELAEMLQARDDPTSKGFTDSSGNPHHNEKVIDYENKIRSDYGLPARKK